MQLCQKQNIFSEFFARFLKSAISFKSFKTKGDPHRFCISDITDSEQVVRSMSKKLRLREPFDKQNGKRADALLKCAS